MPVTSKASFLLYWPYPSNPSNNNTWTNTLQASKSSFLLHWSYPSQATTHGATHCKQANKPSFLLDHTQPKAATTLGSTHYKQASKSSFHLGRKPKQQYLNKYTASSNNNRQQQSLNHSSCAKKLQCNTQSILGLFVFSNSILCMTEDLQLLFHTKLTFVLSWGFWWDFFFN